MTSISGISSFKPRKTYALRRRTGRIALGLCLSFNAFGAGDSARAYRSAVRTCAEAKGISAGSTAKSGPSESDRAKMHACLKDLGFLGPVHSSASVPHSTRPTAYSADNGTLPVAATRATASTISEYDEFGPAPATEEEPTGPAVGSSE